jgi:hypothetical protein
MLRNPAFMSFLTFVAVATSGNPGTITVPTIVGVEPLLPQRPNPAVPAPPGAATKLHCGVGLARIASPSIWVRVARVVLVIPAVDAIPNGAAKPRFTDETNGGGGGEHGSVVKFNT